MCPWQVIQSHADLKYMLYHSGVLHTLTNALSHDIVYAQGVKWRWQYLAFTTTGMKIAISFIWLPDLNHSESIEISEKLASACPPFEQ